MVEVACRRRVAGVKETSDELALEARLGSTLENLHLTTIDVFDSGLWLEECIDRGLPVLHKAIFGSLSQSYAQSKMNNHLLSSVSSSLTSGLSESSVSVLLSLRTLTVALDCLPVELPSVASVWPG